MLRLYWIIIRVFYINIESYRSQVFAELLHFLETIPNTLEDVHENIDANPFESQIRTTFNLFPKTHSNSPMRLNSEQYDIYNAIWNSSRRYHMVKGPQGSSKSYIINYIKQSCDRHSMAFVASGSTGLASMLVGGCTAHSLFVVRKDEIGIWTSLLHCPNNSDYLATLKTLDYIIIDEMSMIGRKLYTLIVDLVNCKDTVKVVFVGDFD